MFGRDTSGREARVRYESGSYRLLAPGDYVVCAVTGKRIPLGELRYWSWELQEAYVDAIAATQRYQQHLAEKER
jgi:hypothetical protein